jgi:membrane-associated protein
MGWGNVAVPVVIFAETGLVDLRTLIPLTILAATAGNEVNYLVGRRSGHVLTRRYRSWENELHRAMAFFESHGGKTIVIARFIPIVRTFAPAVAGASNMRHSRFLVANMVGSVLWVLTVILAGYFFGGLFPQTTNDLYLLIIVVVLGSVVFSVIAWIRGLKQ